MDPDINQENAVQLPSSKTPVSRCEELAIFASRMMSKFPTNTTLTTLSTRMEDAGAALGAAQGVYQAATRAILPTRVDVKYQDIASDRCVRRIHKRAEIADGKKGGAIATMILPKGPTAITKLRGESQVRAMIDFEADLEAAAPSWPEATNLLAEAVQHREDYQAALNGRTQARQLARSRRALRDAEKLRFLATYEEIVRTVQAQFPRDKEMQGLFFDEVTRRSAAQVTDSDEEIPEEDLAAPAPA